MTVGSAAEAPAWLTPGQVAALMGVQAPTGDDAAALEAACGASAAYVARERRDLFDENGGFLGGPDVLLGAGMLAYRWYQRRSSPLGVAEYDQFGTGGLLRHDPDIAKMLGLGADGRFAFGAGGYTPPAGG